MAMRAMSTSRAATVVRPSSPTGIRSTSTSGGGKNTINQPHSTLETSTRQSQSTSFFKTYKTPYQAPVAARVAVPPPQATKTVIIRNKTVVLERPYREPYYSPWMFWYWGMGRDHNTTIVNTGTAVAAPQNDWKEERDNTSSGGSWFFAIALVALVAGLGYWRYKKKFPRIMETK